MLEFDFALEAECPPISMRQRLNYTLSKNAILERQLWHKKILESEARKERISEKQAIDFLNGEWDDADYILPVRYMAIKALQEVKEYRAIGTVKECRKAIEKQTPKKPIEPQEDYGTFKCPSCGGLIYTEDEFETHKFCLMCGQSIDWRVENGKE